MSEKKRTLLVVDDESAVRQVLRLVLTLHGYNVLEAEDYYTALQAARMYDGCIDLLVTDIALPGLNGFELFSKLLKGRAEPQGAVHLRLHWIGGMPILQRSARGPAFSCKALYRGRACAPY
jgi:CheY-like chemotaxis protein